MTFRRNRDGVILPRKKIVSWGAQPWGRKHQAEEQKARDTVGDARFFGDGEKSQQEMVEGLSISVSKPTLANNS